MNFKFNPFEFYGMKQLFSYQCPYSSSIKTKERATGYPVLITTGMFRLCRHPLYLFMLLTLIITSVLSLDHLAIIIYSCPYLVIGNPIEERKFVQIFGGDYIDYQKYVPAIVPFINFKTKKN